MSLYYTMLMLFFAFAVSAVFAASTGDVGTRFEHAAFFLLLSQLAGISAGIWRPHKGSSKTAVDE